MQRTPTANFSQLRETLLGQYTGRIPIAEIDVAVEVQEAFLGHPIWGPEDTVAFSSQAGYDYVLFHVEFDFAHSTFASFREVVDKPARITSLEDAKRLRWPDPQAFDMTELDALAAALPVGMKIIPRLGGLLYFPGVLLGFENLCVAMISDPPLAKYMFDRIGEIVTGLVDRLVRHRAVGSIWLSSDIAFRSSVLVSPNMLRQYVFPWIAKVARLVHEMDMPLVYHSDGNLTDVIPDLVRAGVDALHPIEPLAMDIGAVRRRYGPRLCLIGNVDVDLLIRGTPDDVRREAARLITLFDRQGGFVLGSGNSIPAAVPLENYKALLATRERA